MTRSKAVVTAMFLAVVVGTAPVTGMLAGPADSGQRTSAPQSEPSDVGTATQTLSGANTTFTVSNFTAPTNVTAGERYTVNATISNSGNKSGETTVEYRFNGSVRNSTTVNLTAGETTTVRFEFNSSGVEAGTYTHGIYTTSDNETASITMQSPSGDPAADQGPTAGPPPQDLAAFTETSPVTAQSTTPNSLSGKIRVEKAFKDNTTVALTANTSANYTLQISIPNATNVTFFLQANAVTASQNLSDVKLLIDGNRSDYYENSSAGPGNSPWLLFEITHFSTRSATFTSAGQNPFDSPIPGTGATNAPTDVDGDGRYEDVDGNGAANFDDAVSLAFADTGSLSASQRTALDFDNDGSVTFDDAVELAFAA